MGFFRRNSDALVLEVVGALLLGGVVAGAVFLFDQLREDERFANARQISQEQFDRAQQLANEQYARDTSAAVSGMYSFGAIDLRNTTLNGLELTNCPDAAPTEGKICTNFIEANLSGANLTRTNLQGANISMADLSNTRLSTAVLRHSLGASTTFHCASAVAALLGESELQFADFSDSVWELTQFTNSNLHGSDFSGANISGSDFSGADISGVKFDGTWYRSGLPPTGLPAEILDALLVKEDEISTSCE